MLFVYSNLRKLKALNEHLNSYKQYLNAVDRSNAITSPAIASITTVAEINYIIDDRGELREEQEEEEREREREREQKGGEENKSIAAAADANTQTSQLKQIQQQEENEQDRQQLFDEYLLDSSSTANIRIINQSTLIQTCNQLNELNK